MQRMMSVRLSEEDYKFIERLTKEEKEEKSRILREIIALGRLMLAIEEYKKGNASLSKAAKIAGISLSKFMDILTEFEIKNEITYEEYLQGLENLRKIW